MNQVLETSSRAEASAETVGRRLLPTAGIAIIVSVALVSIVFLIAQAATDSLMVTPPGGDGVEEIGLGIVLSSAIIGGIVGTFLAWVLGRFATRPRNTFLAICVVGLLMYGIVPFAAAEQTATAIWLNVMHLSVAIPIVGGLAMYLPDRRA